MKISKMFLLALSLSFFSCSQEEDTVFQKNLESTSITKISGLTFTELTKLKTDCIAFSTSSDFVAMRSKAQAFADKLNSNVPDLSSKKNLEIWFDTNIQLTQFASKKEAMDMFNDLNNLAEVFTTANKSFFMSLSDATNDQVTIILEPIIPSRTVTTNSNCDDACFDDIAAQDDSAFRFYELCYNVYEASGDEFGMALAELGLTASLNNNTSYLMDCLDAC